MIATSSPPADALQRIGSGPSPAKRTNNLMGGDRDEKTAR